MSSENRSSSAVRNLRSLFENKNGDSTTASSSETRGRSPNALSAGGDTPEISGLRRTSKVRASFVSVEPPANMASLQPSESNTGRRGSLGEADRDLDLKKSLSQEAAVGPETAVSSVAATPNLKSEDKQLGEKEAENPDKPVMGEEEEPRDMKPADPASVEAVSGGQALPPVAEDLRKSTSHQKGETTKAAAAKKPTVNGTGKPAEISTKAPSKAASSTMKSPSSAKTPTFASSASKPGKNESPKAPPPAKALPKKASRSSLTAPTAASMARSGPSEKAASSAAAKAKPRETTKPVSLPSHLTAPTASSRAKHEPEGQTKPSATGTAKPSTTAKPKTSTTAPKSSRSSLAPEHRPGSRTSQTSHTRRSVAPSDGSFLERMMKPTAASASKTHEKTEVKSPPRQKSAAPAKPKANGTASKVAPAKKAESKGKEDAAASTAAPMPSEVPVEEPQEDVVLEPAEVEPVMETAAPETTKTTAPQPQAMPQSTPAKHVEPPKPAAVSDPVTEETTTVSLATEAVAIESPNTTPAAGNETPQGAGETAAGLEATPAGLGSEKAIR